MTQVRTLVCLIPHPERPAILTRPDGGLPTTTFAGDFELPAALAAMEALLGRCPPLLRLEQLTSDDQGEPILLAMDLEAWPGRPPRGMTWTPWADARVIGGALPEVAATLPRWIARREHGPMPGDPPWSVPGWSRAATAWMLERMAEAGTPATDAPRLHYGWGISVVWRTPTADGPCYLKCSTPIFGREAALTARIAQVDPAHTTRVLAVDEARNLLLMRDHGDRALASEPADAWVVGLEALATIQRGWTTATDELVGAGAPIRSLADLATDLLTMADREPLRSELTGPDRVAWDAAVPAFVDACRRLEAIGPAPTLGHGDFHPWNVVLIDGGPVVFDWTDAAVTHPFLDLAVFVTRADDPAVRRRLRDAYLAHWADVLHPTDLAEAGDLAILVGTLYQVESYVRLLSSLEPEDQGGMRGAAGSWARAAIDVLATGIDTRRPGHADG